MKEKQNIKTSPLFPRILKRSIEHIKINKWLSVASTVVIMLTLTISSIILFLVFSLQKAVKEFTEKPRIYVYFYPETDEDSILQVQNEISSYSLIDEIEYESQEKALENIKSKLGTSSSTKITSLASLLPPRLNIKPKSLADTDNIVRYLSNILEDNSYVDEIRYSGEAIANLRAIYTLVRLNGYTLIGISVLVTVLIIFVTINYSVRYYFEELKIMDFLGSNRKFLVFPFVFEALYYGTVGAFLASINMIIFKYGNIFVINRDPILKSFLASQTVSKAVYQWSLSETALDFLMFAGINLLISTVLCSVGSVLAVYMNIDKIKNKGK